MPCPEGSVSTQSSYRLPGKMGHASPQPIVMTTSEAATSSVSNFLGNSWEMSMPTSAMASTTTGFTVSAGADPADVAPALVELAGGSEQLAARAQRFIEGAQPLLALQLLEIALAADPHSLVARDRKRAALELLLAQSGGKNLWERMWIAAELRELEAAK